MPPHEHVCHTTSMDCPPTRHGHNFMMHTPVVALVVDDWSDSSCRQPASRLASNSKSATSTPTLVCVCNLGVSKNSVG